jgi:hypothetical protein
MVIQIVPDGFQSNAGTFLYGIAADSRADGRESN